MAARWRGVPAGWEPAKILGHQHQQLSWHALLTSVISVINFPDGWLTRHAMGGVAIVNLGTTAAPLQSIDILVLPAGAAASSPPVVLNIYKQRAGDKKPTCPALNSSASTLPALAFGMDKVVHAATCQPRVMSAAQLRTSSRCSVRSSVAAAAAAALWLRSAAQARDALEPAQHAPRPQRQRRVQQLAQRHGRQQRAQPQREA